MKGAVLLLLLAGVACASLVGYHIEPVKASWSGWTHRGDTVAQSVVTCWDSLERVELFAGARGNGGVYRAGVWLDGNEVMSSYGDTVVDHGWIKFEDWDQQVAFTKGKTVTIRFTRGGNDSIQFYWAEDPNSPTGNGPYLYGHMIVGGQNQTTRDLAMRCNGHSKVDGQATAA